MEREPEAETKPMTSALGHNMAPARKYNEIL
jgi:hypothetical protein